MFYAFLLVLLAAAFFGGLLSLKTALIIGVCVLALPVIFVLGTLFIAGVVAVKSPR